MKPIIAMKQIKIIIILLITIGACSTPSASTTEVEYIDVPTAQKLIDEHDNMVVLDVRTPEEFYAGHIKGAINININDNSFATKVAKLDKDKSYIVHCAANVKNGRSAKSLEIMSGLDFKNLKSMDGGFAAWQREGLSVVAE